MKTTVRCAISVLVLLLGAARRPQGGSRKTILCWVVQAQKCQNHGNIADPASTFCRAKNTHRLDLQRSVLRVLVGIWCLLAMAKAIGSLMRRKEAPAKGGTGGFRKVVLACCRRTALSAESPVIQRQVTLF